MRQRHYSDTLVREGLNTTSSSITYFATVLVFLLLVLLRNATGQFDNCITGVLDSIGDGWCDYKNNNADCGYDGGDCCPSTCSSSSYGYPPCTSDAIFCFDPLARDYTPLYENCTGEFKMLENGACDSVNNNAMCAFDGGDCCPCTCGVDGYAACGETSFHCLDPDAGDINYDCGPTPQVVAPPCVPSLQSDWVVDDTASATALANSLKNCSGGVFEVEWKGHVVVTQTIRVVDGTTLRVTGIEITAAGNDDAATVHDDDDDSAICVSSSLASTAAGVVDGGGKIRLFAVVNNSSLYLNNIDIRNGSSSSAAVVTSLYNPSYGGAIFVADKSSVVVGNGTRFADNRAEYGGAISVGDDSSILFWSGAEETALKTITTATITTCFGGNSAAILGGAVYVYGNSTISFNVMGDARGEGSWTANFVGNSAGNLGGAIYLIGDSGVYLSSDGGSSGHVRFTSNNAFDGGGAIYVSDGSKMSFDGNTFFSNNSAKWGGAVYATDDSTSVSWGGGDNNETTTMSFTNNSAVNQGGAIYMRTYASGFWGDGVVTAFRNNSSGASGGALQVESSSCFWEGETFFLENEASNSGKGGALSVSAASNVSWMSATIFLENWAEKGGAVYVGYDSYLTWSGLATTSFVDNRAATNGGAIGSSLIDSDREQHSSGSYSSRVFINGNTHFVDNTCGANGGAIALNGALTMAFGPSVQVSFLRNSAAGAGGAVFVSTTSVGSHFVGVSFALNSAAAGGAVYSTGSGTAVLSDPLSNDPIEYPVTYDTCIFTENKAQSTGGAIETTAGKDSFVNATFVGNTAASAGGALRLAGTTIKTSNCSFAENAAGEGGGEGAAVSNVGTMSDLTSCKFSRNTFVCQSGNFVDFPEGNRYSTVCVGCPSCTEGCTIKDEGLVPTCTSAYANSASAGVNVTLETLQIDPGYWRATSTSREILACYHADACLGGVTGASGFCREGYEGPYCSVCSEGYARALAFTCTKCSDGRAVLSAVLIGAVVVVVVVVAISCMVSKEKDGENREGLGSTGDGCSAGRTMSHHVQRRLWLQPLKIVVVVWQIVTQFTSIANVTYPDVYQRFLDGIDLLSFDPGLILSAGCFLKDVDFHDRLLTSTLAPLAVMVLLGITYAVARLRNRESDEALRKVRRKHVSAVLLVTFLVYSSVSSVVFSMFACERLDDGKTYLRADYTIECTSPQHEALQVYAGFMIVIYPVGIPFCYAVILFSNRRALLMEKEHDRELDRGGHSRASRQTDIFLANSISDLWKPYKPARYYYEVIECVRRISLTGVVVFIYPNTAAQIAVTLIIAFGFNVAFEALSPYASRWDMWVSRSGHVVVFISLYMALLLKVDVSGERSDSQGVFAGVLVAAHACLVLAATVEMAAMGYTFFRQEVEGGGAMRIFTHSRQGSVSRVTININPRRSTSNSNPLSSGFTRSNRRGDSNRRERRISDFPATDEEEAEAVTAPVDGFWVNGSS